LVFKGRKGQTFLDILIIGVILFGAAVVFVFVSMVNNQITTELMSYDEFNASTVQGQMLSHWDGVMPATFDNMFMIMFILFWVFIIVSSLFVDSNPIFLIISIVLLIIILSVMGVMSNTYETFIMEDDLFTFSAGFPKMNFVMEHLVLFMVFIGLSGIIAIYGKNALGGTG